MKYALVENDTVTQTSRDKRQGFIECPDVVCFGYKFQNGNFYLPEKSKSALFSEEFKALKEEYDDDVQALNIAFASAAMVDGPSQVDKQTSIRAQYNTRKAEYDAAVAALRTKYYG